MSNKVAKGFRSPKVSFISNYFGKAPARPKPSVDISPALAVSKTDSFMAGLVEITEAEIKDLMSELQEAVDEDDKEGIASAYSQLFGAYSSIKRPDTLEMGAKSLAAAIAAYGAGSLQHAEELSMFAVHYEHNGEPEKARKVRAESIDIFEKTAGVDRFIEALESVFTAESEEHDGDALEAYARRGIAFVEARCKRGTKDYKENMSYLRQMLETAHDEPISREERMQNTMVLIDAIRRSMREKIK